VALRGIVPQLHDGELYGDKIYGDRALGEQLEREQHLRLYTPVKKKKGQKELPMTDRAFSEAVSRVRQPIESLFSWVAGEDRHRDGIQGAFFQRSDGPCLRTDRRSHAYSRFLLLIVN